MKSIRSWSREIHENAVAHGWWDDPDRNTPELLCLIHSEISEALEAYRDGEIDTVVHDNGKPEGFWVEMADAVIRVMDLAGRFDVDLEHIIALKHEYNKTRPHRHGGKLA